MSDINPTTSKNVSDEETKDKPLNKEEKIDNVKQVKKVNHSQDKNPSNNYNKDLIQSKCQDFINLALNDLQVQKSELENDIKNLAHKKSQIDKELKSSFTGQSDAIARKVKGFQEYLTGALQDLTQSAEQLELVVQPVIVQPSPLDENSKEKSSNIKEQEPLPAISDTFKPDEKLIRSCFNKFLDQPDYYAEPWKLRRSLDSKDIDLLNDWFFSMGGRGAQPSRGNRSKNILVTAALIAILGELYGEQFQTLVLASQPERLGEWRRGLQDALGLSREDFGPNSGIVLFERPDSLIERADRLEATGDLPMIIIDAAEISVEIPILQFPIWLAFSASPEELYDDEDIF